MHEQLINIYEHMRDFGLKSLSHANYHASCWSPENPNWAELSVIQAAHAAEILVKARIAQEHPLLIFEHIPKSKNRSALELEHLFEDGKTIRYHDLPERLWASAGIRLANLSLWESFGKLRNTIQHFTYPPNKDFSHLTFEFIFGVLDPLLHHSWGLHAVDFNEDYEPYAYLVPNLISREIEFSVSKELIKDWLNQEDMYDIAWPADNPKYKEKMINRFAEAKAL